MSTQDINEEVTKGIRNTVGIIDADEMAALLQVSHLTLTTWRWRRCGPPFIKVGKKIFYPLSEFATWIGDESARQNALHRTAKKRSPRANGGAKAPHRPQHQPLNTEPVFPHVAGR